MNQTRNVVLAVVFLGAGCATEVEGTDDEGDVQRGGQKGCDDWMSSPDGFGESAAIVETADVHRFSDYGVVAGADANLHRAKCAHELEEFTRELPAGHVVTLFYVVYNAPWNCTNPIPGLSNCSIPDSQNPATQPSVLWADGDIASGSGTANFTGLIGLGLAGAPGEVLFGGGLTNITTSEVHYLTRDKGVPINGRVEEQRTTYGGGCDVATCVDVQFALFPAP